MKAEERHRLAENELVKGLNRLAAGTRRPPNLVIFMVGLLVVVIVVYWIWSTTASNRVAQAWVNYAERQGSLEDAPESLKAGPAGQAILLASADAAYENGYNQLFTSSEQSLAQFEHAAKLYAALAQQATNSDMQLRAMVGAGKAYESLGKVEEAVAQYDAVLAKFGSNHEWKDHPLLQDARNHKAKLTAGEGSLSSIYRSWTEKLKRVGPAELKPPTLPTIPTPPSPIKD
jgi:tetratricopeptide (TPR) repeat protein